MTVIGGMEFVLEEVNEVSRFELAELDKVFEERGVGREVEGIWIIISNNN